MQDEKNIKFNKNDEAVCTECDELLKPIYENNGFTAPDPEHIEIVGYKDCQYS